jgi:hypothetical protein
MSPRRVRDILESWTREGARVPPQDRLTSEDDPVCPLTPEQRRAFAQALVRAAQEGGSSPADLRPEWLPPA